MRLPPEAMQWGRWYEGITDETQRQLDAQMNDASSVGRQFRGRADLLARQIAGVQNVSTQQTFLVPTFNRTSAAGSGNLVFFVSPTYTFTPPKPTGQYRMLAIASINCTDTSDLSFSPAYIKVNGLVTQTQSATDNRIPTGTQNSMNVSVAGMDSVSEGQSTSVEFAISGSGFFAHDVTFAACTLTVVYVGGL